MLDIIEHEWGRALPSSYAARVGEMIESGFRQSLAPIDGVAQLLDALRLPRCVASSSLPEQIRRKLELTGLLTQFGENLFSATMVARGKPAPDLFLYAAEQLRTAPTRCLVIEDSPAGIDAAIAAGMTAIGFSGGSHCGPAHAARLQARGAKLVSANMRELADCSGEARLSPRRLRLALKKPISRLGPVSRYSWLNHATAGRKCLLSAASPRSSPPMWRGIRG